MRIMTMIIEESINTAILHGATDIHLCPTSSDYKAQYRIAGKITCLHEERIPNNSINRVKILSNLDISETRRVQEGQFSYTYKKEQFFIRVSIVNTRLGEKVALRILPTEFNYSLEKIKLPHPLYLSLTEALKKPKGIIFVCGATGAGKTTTLYSCLEYLNNGERSIFTIEDPIEFNINEFYQCELNPHINITPQYLLKSLLRQDPDIIFIGELRDKATAELALTAAHTGHLVLTTIHTNSALELFYRLQSWDIDIFTLASALNFVLHQRMTFHDNIRSPTFSAVVPSWGKKPPQNYHSLINDTNNWVIHDDA